jgi:hypothetical protein
MEADLTRFDDISTGCWTGRMGGSKSKQPWPSSNEGKIRDPEIETLVRERGTSGEAEHDLIKEAARPR